MTEKADASSFMVGEEEWEFTGYYHCDIDNLREVLGEQPTESSDGPKEPKPLKKAEARI